MAVILTLAFSGARAPQLEAIIIFRLAKGVNSLFTAKNYLGRQIAGKRHTTLPGGRSLTVGNLRAILGARATRFSCTL
jgi:hypothetical protein